MSVSNKLFYRLVSSMLSSQDKIIIKTVKFEMIDIAFILKKSFEGQSNGKNELNHAMNMRIFPSFCFRRQDYLSKDLVAHNQAKFQHSTTFDWRDIAFRI